MLGGKPAWRRWRQCLLLRSKAEYSGSARGTSPLLLTQRPPGAQSGVKAAGGRWDAPRSGGAGWAEAASRNSTQSSGLALHPRFLCRETWGSRWILFCFFVLFLRDLSSPAAPRGPRTPPGAGILTVESAGPAPSSRLGARDPPVRTR